MPPTPDEIEAAAGRLREIAAPTTPGNIWHHYPFEDIFAMRHAAQVVLADAWLARPITVPVGTPEEVAAARVRIARVICDGEDRELVFGSADWLPLARADNNLVGRADAQRSRLKDPVYQQGYNDGLLAATVVPPAAPTDPKPEEPDHVPCD